jgi:hypothetical protein
MSPSVSAAHYKKTLEARIVSKSTDSSTIKVEQKGHCFDPRLRPCSKGDGRALDSEYDSFAVYQR